MKLSAAFEVWSKIFLAFKAALVPTLCDVLKNPFLLVHPQQLSHAFFGHIWKVFGPDSNERAHVVKQTLITPNACGVVLDIGAGTLALTREFLQKELTGSLLGLGHTALYLDPTKVTKYVALEPNANMHAGLRARAASRGFTEEAGTFALLPYGAQDTALISSALGGPHAADTLVLVLTLCSVPEPEAAIASLVRDVLRPGGTLVFYEHVLSPRADVAWWQRFWTPMWRYFADGCCLDRPSHLWIMRMGCWSEKAVWGEEDASEEDLYWRQIGKCVKA